MENYAGTETCGVQDEIPELEALLEGLHVVALPLHTRFRGQTVREIALLEGPEGWTEFSPFPEYADAEASAWLRGAIDFGWRPAPPPADRDRTRISVNATLPAVGPADVERVLAHYDGCRTVKVKVAEPGQTLDDDVARVRRVRDVIGAEGRIRVDANGGWNVDGAEHAVHRLAEFDLEYIEQPCIRIDELAELRERIAYLGILVAADESVRKAEDPLAVARAGAADLLVVKAQPLGGIRRALAIVAEAGLPAVISSALESSVGIAMGAHLAAALPALDYDCGLATVDLFTGDVVPDARSLVPRGGSIPVERPGVDPALLAEHRVSAEREQWWRERVIRCHALLA